MSTSIGQRLKAAREAAGLTQEKAAAQIGVSMMTVSRWERGQHVAEGAQLGAAARVYGRSVDWILQGDAAPAERLERDDAPAALVEYFAEREASGRPVRPKVADRARASARSTGMATRTEAAALVDFLEGVVAREERGDAPPPNDPRAVINEAAGQRAVTRRGKKRGER